MTERTRNTTLDAAASALSAVAFGDPFVTPARVRLPCLWAVELLRAAGAVPIDDVPRVDLDAAGRIRAALLLLSLLPVEVFADSAVLEAAAAARLALDAAG